MERGGSLSISERSHFEFIDSDIRSSDAIFGTCFYVTEFSTVNITNSKFSDSNTFGSLFDISSSTINIVNSTIENNFNNIFLIDQSNLTIFCVIISNQICDSNIQGCIVSAGIQTKVEIDNLMIQNLASFNEFNLVIDSSIAIFQGFIMRNISSYKEKGCCLGSISSKINIQNSLFENYLGNGLYFEKSSILLENVFLNNNLGTMSRKNYAGIQFLDCQLIKILNSCLYNNQKAISGGAINFRNQNKLDINPNNASFGIISGCKFLDNQAIQQGGACYLENQNLKFDNCIFFANRAEKGGGIFIFIDGIKI